MRSLKKLIAFCLIAASLAMLTSCQPKIVVDDGRYLDKKTGIYYTYASSVYEVVGMTTDIYAILKENGVEKAYHAIEGASTEDYLVDEYGDILCAEGKDLPDLGGFKPSEAFVCTNTDRASSIAVIDNTALINKLVDIYTNGENVPFNNTAEHSFTVKFISEKYPFLYFNLTLMVEEDGSVYLWEREFSRYVNVGTLLDKYIEGHLN
jgi:hypothetical protein